jgi:micrococcal nuclease
MSLTSIQLRYYQAQLRVEEARLKRELAIIKRSRLEYLQRGAATDALTLKSALALQIRNLDDQATGVKVQLGVIERRSQLLAYLVYAQENADDLKHDSLGDVDWASMLAVAEATRASMQARIERLEALLTILRRGQQPEPALPSAPTRPAAKPARPAKAPGEVATVHSVPDGDGLKLEDRRRVRYIGIDAPEMTTWGGGGAEAWAKEARALNSKLVTGNSVRLVKDTSETDPYGRLLRYVYVGDTFVNAELLKSGLARTLRLPPDTKFAAEFERLEEEARKKHVGMWK